MVDTGPVSPVPAELSAATQKPDIVEVPPRLLLSLSGAGAPDSPAFSSPIAALYGIAYGLKFQRKKAGGQDFKVGPMACVWWAEGDNLPTDRIPDRDAWRWMAQMDVPPDVTEEEVTETVAAAVAKKGGKLEGNACAQSVALSSDSARRFGRILHVGSYADEARSFAAIGAVLEAEGLKPERWHIEVYVSDPTRTPPEKLKTVLLTPIME